MPNDTLPSPNPYRPYVVPLDSSHHLISPSRSTPRDLLADLDIPTDYLENPELSELLSSLFTQGISKYAAVFIRQPFEVVKTIMQVQYISLLGRRPASPPAKRKYVLDTEDEFEVSPRNQILTHWRYLD